MNAIHACILGLIPAVTAVAQSTRHAPSPAKWPVVPAHSRLDATDGAYGLWAAGRRYKIAFDDVTTFVPYLGATRPQNAAWSWRTTAVHLGGAPLPLTPTAPRVVHGARVERALGPVVEAWDVLAGGAEQTFVVDELPNAGDLVVRGAVTTTLIADAVSPTTGAVLFCDADGAPVVSYGTATAVDAAGRRRAMTTRYVDGELELRLDGAWLAEAALPVVVDPLISNVAVAADDVVAADVVRDPAGGSNDGLFVAYERAASAADSDIWLLRLDDAATTSTLAYADLSASWSTTEPAVAFVGEVASAVMAWTHESSTGERTVRWIVRGQHFTPEFVVPGPPGANDWRPDVGGALAGSPDTSALIVFQRELNAGPFVETDSSVVVSQLVDAGATSSQHAMWTQEILSDGGFDNERPAVNQVGEGTPDHAWLVAWQRYSDFPNPSQAVWRLGLRKVSRYGYVTQRWATPSAPLRHDMAPQIAGLDGRYTVAFAASDRALSSPKPEGPAGHELHALRVDWPGVAPWPDYPHATALVDAAATARLELTGASHDEQTGSHWLLATRDAATDERAALTIGHTGALVEAVQVAPPGAAAAARAGISFDAANDRHVLATGTATGAGSGALELAAVTLPFAMPPTTTGTSCSTAGIGWSGSQVIGSEFSELVVAGAEPGALHFALVATAPASAPIGDVGPFLPGCSLLVSGQAPSLLGALPLTIGAVAQWRVPLPENLPPMVLHFQGVHTAGGLSGLVTTERLSVPIVR